MELLNRTASEEAPTVVNHSEEQRHLKPLKFIDLFAGLGGFHRAMRELGHEFVFGCEISPTLRATYKQNFGVELEGNIADVDIPAIEPFDILCAGFPCQSFSKAGKQKGRDDHRGALFDYILDILQEHTPEYFILENVPHLARHNEEQTWRSIESDLRSKGYSFVDRREYSPHQFGIPQHRRRIYILGSRVDRGGFTWIDDQIETEPTDIRTVLENHVGSDTRLLDAQQQSCIDVWQSFLEIVDADEPLGFPIWSYEFGATYPFETETPFSCVDLSSYKGSFGINLAGANHLSSDLPSYARTEEEQFPAWKQHYIRQNRKLFAKYRSKLERLVPRIQQLPIPSWQKFEWNCQFEPRTIRDKILQFRASGLRVKKTDFIPSLVCTNTQVPIIAWENRYITKREALKLQSFPPNFVLPEIGHAAYVALGNAVNVEVIRRIAAAFVGAAEPLEQAVAQGVGNDH